jgi:hypothetical protein
VIDIRDQEREQRPSMPPSLRDATPADIPSITAIYRDCVLNGTATYEIAPPDEAEMGARFSSIREKGYPYVVAEDTGLGLLGYAYASAFRTRPAYRWMVEDSIICRRMRAGGASASCCSETCCGVARASVFARSSPSSAGRSRHRSRCTGRLAFRKAAC